jgi:hypothetical protein
VAAAAEKEEKEGAAASAVACCTYWLVCPEHAVRAGAVAPGQKGEFYRGERSKVKKTLHVIF